MKIRPIIILVAGCVVLLCVTALARDVTMAEQRVDEPQSLPDTHVLQSFQTLEDAQALAPFELRMLAPVPTAFRLASVTVNSRPVSEDHRRVTTVEALYRSTNGRMISLTQRDAPFRHSVSDGVTINHADVDVYVATEVNSDGSPVGIVSWDDGGVTYILAQNGVHGNDLIDLVTSVQ